jgi:hypothetical protein
LELSFRGSEEKYSWTGRRVADNVSGIDRQEVSQLSRYRIGGKNRARGSMMRQRFFSQPAKVGEFLD